MRIDKDRVDKRMRKKGFRKFGDLAMSLGVGSQALSNWFAGGPFSSVSLAALCKALDCSPNDVLVWKEDEETAKVGERTKAPSTSSGAERTAPAPDLTITVPSPLIVVPDDGTGRPASVASQPAVAELAEAPLTAASLRKPLALQLPGIGQEGEPDRAKFAALEERRRMLLAQAKGGK